MSYSVNKAILIGNVGQDLPHDSQKKLSFTLATNESWKDKNSGEWKNKVEWHKVAIFNEKLAEMARANLKKGSRVYVEGQIRNNEYEDKFGNKKISVEIVVSPYQGTLIFLDSKSESQTQPKKQSNDDWYA